MTLLPNNALVTDVNCAPSAELRRVKLVERRFEPSRRFEQGSGRTAEDIYRREVLELHRFLDAWLKGEVPKGSGRPERFAQALAEDLCVIHPSGKRGTKAAAVRAFAAAYGEKPPGYALVIGRVDTRMIGEGLCLATYEEWHRGEPGRARVASALLRQRADGGGIEWLFLQETLAPHLEQERPAAE